MCLLTLANGEQNLSEELLSYGDAAKTNSMLTAWRVCELTKRAGILTKNGAF